MTILDQLADHARERVVQAKRQISLIALRAQAEQMPKGDFAFEKSLAQSGIRFICECKKASPSKGVIAPDFPYLDIARAYQAAGADCLSVLTEPKWFLGSDQYLEQIAAAVSIPCLRKDFTIDAYMIYQAKCMGAGAVLLICSLLSTAQLGEYLALCDALGLSALVEIHDAREADVAVCAGARMVGVNHRNLKDFSMDMQNSSRLRECIPREVLFVSESGIQTADEVRGLEQIGADAVLIGEALMRAPDKRAMLAALRGTV